MNFGGKFELTSLAILTTPDNISIKFILAGNLNFGGKFELTRLTSLTGLTSLTILTSFDGI